MIQQTDDKNTLLILNLCYTNYKYADRRLYFNMTAVFTAFAEYLFKFVVYLAVAAGGVLLGIKFKKSKDAKKSAE